MLKLHTDFWISCQILAKKVICCIKVKYHKLDFGIWTFISFIRTIWTISDSITDFKGLIFWDQLIYPQNVQWNFDFMLIFGRKFKNQWAIWAFGWNKFHFSLVFFIQMPMFLNFLPFISIKLEFPLGILRKKLTDRRK